MIRIHEASYNFTHRTKHCKKRNYLIRRSVSPGKLKQKRYQEKYVKDEVILPENHMSCNEDYMKKMQTLFSVEPEIKLELIQVEFCMKLSHFK